MADRHDHGWTTMLPALLVFLMDLHPLYAQSCVMNVGDGRVTYGI